MEYSILNGTEDFPYPVTITRDDFAHDSNFDPDTFLFENHRFTSLDSLLTDLKALSKTLNQDLLDLVNDEYANFIQLGQSIGGCLELINNISLDVGRFNSSLGTSLKNFTESSQTADNALKHKRRLNLLKIKIKLILLLHEQCSSFETLLGLDIGEAEAGRLVAKLSTLATLFLSISKIFAVLMESSNSDDAACVFFEKVVKTKVISLKFEFKPYLDEILAIALADRVAYGELLLQLLHVYRITGHSADVLPLRKR